MADQKVITAAGLIAALRTGLDRAGINEAIANSIAALIVALDEPQPGLILYATVPADELFGYIPGELNGKYIRDLIPEDLRVGHDEHFTRFSQQPSNRAMGVSHMKITGLRRDGAAVPLAIALTPQVITEQRCCIATIVPLVIMG